MRFFLSNSWSCFSLVSSNESVCREEQFYIFGLLFGAHVPLIRQKRQFYEVPIGANQFRPSMLAFFSEWHNFRSGYRNQNLLSVSLSPQSKSFRLKYNIYLSKRMPPSEYIDFGLRGCSVIKKKIGSLFHEYTVLCGRHFNDHRSIALFSSDIVNFIPPF